MQVQLLKNVVEKDREGKEFIRDAGKPGTSRHKPMIAGAVIDMSEASAAKYIERGIAKPYEAPQADDATPKKLKELFEQYVPAFRSRDFASLAKIDEQIRAAGGEVKDRDKSSILLFKGVIIHKIVYDK